MSKSVTIQNSNTLELEKLCYNNNNSIYIDCCYFIKCNDYTVLIKHILFTINKFIMESKNNKNSLEFNVIINGKGMKLNNLDYDFLKMLFPFLEEKYPGMVKLIYLTNMPLLFKAAYTVIRSCLHKDTRKKIRFIKTKGSQKIEIEEENYESVF